MRAGTAATLARPGEAVARAIRDLYEALCYAVPCTDCEALAGEPCRPYRLVASRSCAPPQAVASYDPHRARRDAVWPHVHGLSRSVLAVRCPACGGAIETRFPASPLHVCSATDPSGAPSLADDVAASLAAPEAP